MNAENRSTLVDALNNLPDYPRVKEVIPLLKSLLNDEGIRLKDIDNNLTCYILRLEYMHHTLDMGFDEHGDIWLYPKQKDNRISTYDLYDLLVCLN